MATETSQSMTVKLLIDARSQKVLFAEAGKDFVDFLFTLLALPVGTVVSLLSSNAMLGSIGKLYSSFESLDDSYVLPGVSKDVLLKPKLSIASPSTTILSLTNDAPSGVKALYTCPYCRSRGSDNASAICPDCNRAINNALSYVAPPGARAGSTSEAGFVRGVVTYMIMDDLEVMPMSTISSITMLNRFNVKEVGSLQEKTVSVDMKEGLKLLKASLQSKSVLSCVFLEK